MLRAPQNPQNAALGAANLPSSRGFESMTDPATGILEKRLLVDLLDIDDPKDIGGPLPEVPRHTFTFPLQSVESVTPIDDFTLLVGLDNNYPGGNGRVPGTPDGTESSRSARSGRCGCCASTSATRTTAMAGAGPHAAASAADGTITVVSSRLRRNAASIEQARAPAARP